VEAAMRHLAHWARTIGLVSGLLLTTACIPGNNGGGWGVGGQQGDTSTEAVHAKGGIVIGIFSDIAPAMQALVPVWQRSHPGIPVVFAVAATDNIAVNQNTYITQDVVISDSRTVLVNLLGQGLIENEGVTFAAGTLDFAVPSANPGGIHTLQDAARPGLNLVYPRWTTGLAQYTHATLERMMRTDAFAPGNIPCLDNYANCVTSNMTLVVADGISAGKALVNNSLVNTPVPDHQFPLDGAFIYHSDLVAVEQQMGAGSLISIPVPTTYAPPNGIWAAVSAYQGVNHANAALFQQFLTTPAAQAVLRAQGFLPPSAASPHSMGSTE
jgi:ABC-type molybdate transport system substrate-binding protein